MVFCGSFHLNPWQCKHRRRFASVPVDCLQTQSHYRHLVSPAISAGGLLQRLQNGLNFLFVVGVLADMLSHNDLQVAIDANLGIAGVIEAVALFAHDASIGIGKAYLIFYPKWLCRGQAVLRVAQGPFWPL